MSRLRLFSSLILFTALGLVSGGWAAAQSAIAQSAIAQSATAPSAAAQPPASMQGGMPFPSRYYSGDDYNGTSRNWAVTQDSRGIVYLGNKEGLYTYDGEQWRSLTLPESLGSHTVRSLSVDSTDRVFVGLGNDFGLLTSDSTHLPTYQSLASHVPDSLRPFKDVWTTFSTDQGTYFQTRSALFRWDGSELRTWTVSGGIHTAFHVQGQVYVRAFDHGLLTPRADSLHLVPGGDTFDDQPVQALLPLSEDRLLVGTAKDGLYTLDSTGTSRFETKAAAPLVKHRLYDGVVLSPGIFALSTLGGGVVIMDDEGRHLQTLRPGSELAGSIGNDLHVGRDGQLWIAFHNAGVQRLQVLSSVTRFGKEHGLEGLIASIERHDGTLYVGTGAGLYRYQSIPPGSRSERTSFQKIPDVPFVLDMISSPEGLLVATDLGLYRVREGSTTRLTTETAFAVQASQVHSGRYYLGTLNGLSLLPSISASPVPINGLTSQVRFITEASDGSLWVSRDTTLIHVEFDGRSPSEASVSTYTQSDGLPGSFSSVVTCGDRVYLFGRQGLHRILEYGDRLSFTSDTSFFDGINDSGLFHFLSTASNRDRWVVRGDRVYRSPPTCDAGELPEWEPVPALHFPKSRSVRSHIDSTGTAWVSDGPLLYRYDLTQDATLFNDAEPLVRRVIRIADGRVLYGGAEDSMATASGADSAPPTLTVPSAQGNLRFEYASPLYNVTTPNQYQIRLEGRDESWSSWSTSTTATYTNLWEGTYTLRIRARSERGTIRESTAFTFRVVPPWYRTTGAYLFYLVFGLGLIGAAVYGVSLYQETQRRRKQAKELKRQRQVNSRLEHANDRLRRANTRLREANELKENFLASTSHELRTPLSNMMGYADVIAEEAPPSLERFADAIQESGNELLQTLDALLHLSGLRAGAYTPEPEPLDFADFVQDIAAPYASTAQEQGVDLSVRVPDDPVDVQVDPTASAQILRNLLDNAFKFTDEGSVQVLMTCEEEIVTVSVSDTGVGISPEFIPHLFEDFKQESEGLTREFSGTGIGLAVTKRFADLIGATIEVDSKKDEGTTFTVHFPRSPSHRGNTNSTPPTFESHQPA